MLPKETIEAIFPRAVQVGEISLGPLTLKHATVMEVCGIVVAPRNCNDILKSYEGCWLLTIQAEDITDDFLDEDFRRPRLSRWIRESKLSSEDAVSGLDWIMKMAFDPFVPGKKENKKRFDDLGEGYGWTLELGECLSHEYGITFDDALEIPLSRVFGLMAAMRQRNSGESGGADYYDRIRSKVYSDIFKKAREENV